MENVNENATVPETTDTPTTTAALAENKKRVKARPYEELEQLAPNKMTDAEKNNYIKELREALSLETQRSHAYQENAKVAYDQARQVSQAFQDYKIQAQGKLNWAKQCIDHCRTAIILAGDIEK